MKVTRKKPPTVQVESRGNVHLPTLCRAQRHSLRKVCSYRNCEGVREYNTNADSSTYYNRQGKATRTQGVFAEYSPLQDRLDVSSSTAQSRRKRDLHACPRPPNAIVCSLSAPDLRAHPEDAAAACTINAHPFLKPTTDRMSLVALARVPSTEANCQARLRLARSGPALASGAYLGTTRLSPRSKGLRLAGRTR